MGDPANRLRRNFPHCAQICGTAAPGGRSIEISAAVERHYSNWIGAVRLVREIVQAGDRTRAAIASKRAAQIYRGQILREHLEDDPENYTRFVLLAPLTESAVERADKISLVFRLAHVPGALFYVLEPFARRKINLMKVESRPVRGLPWQYRFYLDLQASASDPEVKAALGELEKLAVDVRVLGSYVSAKSDISNAS